MFIWGIFFFAVVNVCACVVWIEIWIQPMFHLLCNTPCWQCFGNCLILGARLLWLLIFEYLSPMGWLPSNNVAKRMFNHQFSTVLKSFPFNNFDFDKRPSNEKRKWKRKVDAKRILSRSILMHEKDPPYACIALMWQQFLFFYFQKPFRIIFRMRFHVNYYYSFENIEQYTVEKPLLFL